MKFVTGIDRQRQIFLDTLYGKRPLIPQGFEQLESNCMQSMNRKYFNYIFTGAGNNQGTRNNQTAFQQYEILPKWCRGLESPNGSVEMLGLKLPHPLFFAPIGVLELAHKNADLEVAKASNTSGIPMIVSCQASVPMERIAAQLQGTPWWFQLYFSRSQELTKSLISRAENAGASAIVLTLDTVMLGWRNLDLDSGYLPFLEGKGIAHYTSDPYFLSCLKDEEILRDRKEHPTLLHLIKLFRAFPGSLMENLRTKDPVKAVQLFTRVYSRPGLNWSDIEWLRTQTELPVILKGILHPDDAKQLHDTGCDGLIVSNHGGRQINNNAASLNCLLGIRNQVPDAFPVLLDSGIRSGTDIFIALALGANAVCIGRPYVYALQLAGQAGVCELMANYISELKILMSLTGCSSLTEIKTSGLVQKRDVQKI